MSEQELREKIVEILTERFGIMPIDEVLYFFEGVADALISAGIVDVSELKKHRMMITKDGTIKQLYSGEEIEQIIKKRDEYKHRAEVAELVVKNLNDIFAFDYQYVFKQAEKELQEERI